MFTSNQISFTAEATPMINLNAHGRKHLATYIVHQHIGMLKGADVRAYIGSCFDSRAVPGSAQMAKLIFKHCKLMDRYSADNKDTGDHYVIVPLSSGLVRTFINGDMVDERIQSVRDAKRNVNEELEYEYSRKMEAL